MTKEELKQKAEVCMHNTLFWLKLPISKENVEQGGSYILKLLEPREKQIQIDAEQIRALQKQNGELTDKVNELEAQLEREKNLNQCLSDHNEQLRELEKENAELSMKRKAERKIFQGIVEKKNDQLTKAKEIIKELVRVEYADFTNGDYSNELSKVLEQAEQFLKGSE